jgi:hypothetical protein
MFRPFQFPGVALAQPVIRLLRLAAVLDALAEHAVFVADAVAHHRQLEGGAAIQEAGRQTAEAAVAQAGVVLDVDHLLQIQAQAMQGRIGGFPEPQVEQRVVEGAPHQEFQGEVVGMLRVLLLIGIAGASPAFHQTIPQGQGQRLIGIVGGTAMPVAAQIRAEIAADIQRQTGVIHAERRQLKQLRSGMAGAQGPEMAGRFLLIHGRCGPKSGMEPDRIKGMAGRENLMGIFSARFALPMDTHGGVESVVPPFSMGEATWDGVNGRVLAWAGYRQVSWSALVQVQAGNPTRADGFVQQPEQSRTGASQSQPLPESLPHRGRPVTHRAVVAGRK